MKCISFIPALLLLVSPIAKSESGQAEPLSFSADLSAALVAELPAAIEGESWEYRSLSCLYANIEATGDLKEGFHKEECTLENATGEELRLSEGLSTKLIDSLDLLKVVPMTMPGIEMRLYTVKDLRCSLSNETASCQISSETALPFQEPQAGQEETEDSAGK